MTDQNPSFRKPGKLKALLRQLRYLMGVDIFISYARLDGTLYATKLEELLDGMDFTCFIDSKGLYSGDDLTAKLKRWIKKSRVCVLVGTKGVLESDHVTPEIEEFKRLKRTIIPINIQSSLTNPPWKVLDQRLIRINEMNLAEPSPEIFAEIRRLFQYRRSSQLMRWFFSAVIAVLLVISAAALWQGRKVRLRTTELREEQQKLQASNEQLKNREQELEAKNKELEKKQNDLVAKTREAEQEKKAAEENALKAQEQEQLAHVNAQRASEQEKLALERQREAFSRELASNAVSQFRVDPERSLLLAVEAAQVPTEQTEDALRQSLLASNVRAVLRGHHDHVNKVAVSPDSKFIVTASDDGTAQVWEMNTARRVAVLEHHSHVTNIEFSPDGRYLITGRNYYTYVEPEEQESGTQITELSTQRIARVTEGSKFVAEAAINRDGTLAVTRDIEDKEPRVWELASGKTVAVLRGHTNLVTNLQFSPDGKQILTGSIDQTARLWDARTGNCLVVFSSPHGHKAAVTDVAFSGDGKYVSTTSFGEGVACVWETSTGWLLAHTDTGDQGSAKPATFSPSGRSLLIRSVSGTIPWVCTWGERPQQRSTDDSLQGHKERVNSARFSPDGNLIVTASDDRTARLWNAETKERVGLLMHPHIVIDAMFSPDSRFLVTTCADKVARVWDALTGELMLELPGHIDQIEDVAFSPNGKFILTASDDGTVRVWEWDLNNKRGMLTLEGHTASLINATYSPDGKLIMGYGWGDDVHVWEASTGRTVSLLKGHKRWVNSAAFSPDSRWIVTTSPDAPARVWDARSGEKLFDLKAPDAYRAVFSPNGNFIATFGLNGTVAIWDSSGRGLLELNGYYNEDGGILFDHAFGQFGPNNAGPFSPDSKLIVVGHHEGNTAHVCDMSTGRVVLELSGHTDSIRNASFSSDGKLIVTVSEDETARVWDAVSGRSLYGLKNPTGKIVVATFSPNVKTLVALGDDGVARVWDAHNGRSIASLLGHTLPVTSISFSANGRLIITGSKDSTARIWEARTGHSLLELKGHESSVYSAAFSPDGRFVVTGSIDATAKIYNCEMCGSLDDLLTIARRRLQLTKRKLTPEEQREYLHEP